MQKKNNEETEIDDSHNCSFGNSEKTTKLSFYFDKSNNCFELK